MRALPFLALASSGALAQTYSMNTDSAAVLNDVGTHTEHTLRTGKAMPDTAVRPVVDSSDPVEVAVGFFFNGLTGVDEAAGAISTSMIVEMEWKNPYLAWEHMPNHTDVDMMVFDSSEVWMPDVEIYNLISEVETAVNGKRVRVYQDGKCTYTHKVVITTKCNFVLDSFPFDTQNCPVYIGARYLTNAEQKVTYKLLQASSTEPNYDALSWVRGTPTMTLTAQTWEQNLDESVSTIDMASIDMPLTRNSQFFVSNTIYPVFMVTGVAYLSFFLPQNMIERMVFGAAGVLTIVAIMFIVADKLPQTDAQTKIDKFFNLSLAFNIFACAESALVITMATNAQFRFIKQRIRQIPCNLGYLLLPKTIDRLSRYFFVLLYVVLCAEFIELIVVSLAAQALGSDGD